MRGNLTVGAFCAVTTGISYLAMGLTYANIHFHFIARWDSDSMLFWLGVEIAVGAALALGSIRPITENVDRNDSDLLTWAYNIALFAFGVTLVDSLVPLKGNAARLFDLDPYNWLTHGGIGFWIFVTSLLAMRNRTWPKYMSVVGITCSALLMVFVVSGFFPESSLSPIVGFIGGCLFMPLWFILVAQQLVSAPGARRLTD